MTLGNLSYKYEISIHTIFSGLCAARRTS